MSTSRTNRLFLLGKELVGGLQAEAKTVSRPTQVFAESVPVVSLLAAGARRFALSGHWRE